MKTKTTVFYNDTECASFEATKNYLFETFADEEGWLTPDEIPDCVVYHEMDEERRREWDDFKTDLEYVFDKDCYLLVPSIQEIYLFLIERAAKQVIGFKLFTRLFYLRVLLGFVYLTVI